MTPPALARQILEMATCKAVYQKTVSSRRTAYRKDKTQTGRPKPTGMDAADTEGILVFSTIEYNPSTSMIIFIALVIGIVSTAGVVWRLLELLDEAP